MSEVQSDIKQSSAWGLSGAIGTALAASVCCLGPLVLVALGVTGAWIGSLSALEPYRPIFMVITFGFLGFAFYRVYRKPKAESCEPGSHCAKPGAGRLSKIALWVITAIAALLLAVPSMLGAFNPGDDELLSEASPAAAPNPRPTASTSAKPNKTIKLATLAIQNMTCDGCVTTVTTALKKVDGVLQAKVTLKPPQAIVKYDPSKAAVTQLLKATADVGYPSTLLSEKDA